MHALLLVFFFFAVGWRAPNPPYPDYGIELNFGLDDQGSGEIQPETPVGSEQQEAKTEDAQVETPQQEEKSAETEPKTVEEQLTAKDESAVAVKDVKKEDTPLEKPKEKTDQKVTPKENEKPLAVYNPDLNKKSDARLLRSSPESFGPDGQGKTGQPGSEGDDVNKTGDKGKKEGSLGPGAYTGKPGGGGGGSSLNIDGWLWDEIPKPTVPSSESNGRVVFEIKVNAEGEIISIKTLTRTLSMEMENSCRREIEKLTFTRTGTNVPSISTGKITFVVLSK